MPEVTLENLLELKKLFLKLEVKRWKSKKTGDNDEYLLNTGRINGIFTSIQILGLEEEFGIRRAGPYYKEIDLVKVNENAPYYNPINPDSPVSVDISNMMNKRMEAFHASSIKVNDNVSEEK